MKKKILIISHEFPPTWHGGVIRIYSLVKQMVLSNDFQIDVLAADDSYSLNIFKRIEPFWGEKGTLRVFKTKSLEPRSRTFHGKVLGTLRQSLFEKVTFFLIKNIVSPFLIPDRSILWLPFALISGIKILKQKKVDVIFSTAPPFTNHLVAKTLSVLFHKKLIVDFRDDWVGNPFYDNFYPRKNINKLQERWVLNKNVKIITTTIESKDRFLNKYGSHIDNKITVIPNGFDDELNAKILLATKISEVSKNKKTAFLYTGSLTQKRTPEFFLKAIRYLVDHQCISAHCLEINFVGFSPLSHRILVQQLNLEHVVKFIDPVTQDQLINFYVTCDLLLLFQRSSEGGQTAIPGKFYEYLCTGKPILLMSDGGATDRVLRECHAGYLVKYDDIDAIVHTISLILPQIKSRSSLEIFNRDNLQDYSRSSINNRIINIIKQA